jgi:hypothetical protein
MKSTKRATRRSTWPFGHRWTMLGEASKSNIGGREGDEKEAVMKFAVLVENDVDQD